jgi:hypothetical protein
VELTRIQKSSVSGADHPRVGRVILFALSILIGGLITLLWLNTDSELLVQGITLLASALGAAITVRVGGSVGWSLLNGYAIGFINAGYTWVDNWDVVLADVLKPKFLEVLGWKLWLMATYLLPAATIGFILGAIWVHKQDLSGNARSILVQSLTAISISAVVWLLWIYVISDFARPFY